MVSLDLNLFRVFEAIYAEGSLTGASRVLHKTQQALSYSLARLREHFQDELFIRQGRKLAPTPKARQMIAEVRASLAQLQQLGPQPAAFEPKTARRHFRLGLRDVLEATEKLHKALLNSVSHDLRIPLVTINGTLSSLLDADLRLDPDTEKEMVQSALSEAERLTRLVSNLLQMSKMEAGSLKLNIVPCDPWDLISTTVAGLQSRLKRRTISLHGEEDQPLVPVDYVLIQQVLINLLENSLQHGQGAIRVGLESRPESLLFWVEDDGESISPDLEGRLFERFSRGRELADGGSGLGLSICKGLVEAHRGKIWLEGGRRFCFSLPLEDEDE